MHLLFQRCILLLKIIFKMIIFETVYKIVPKRFLSKEQKYFDREFRELLKFREFTNWWNSEISGPGVFWFWLIQIGFLAESWFALVFRAIIIKFFLIKR
jgi:hypothetical protein